MFRGKLVSAKWGTGTSFSIQTGHYGSNNMLPGGSFDFASEDEATRKWYANGNPITEDFPKTVTFFNHNLYQQLRGHEGAVISWEYNRALVPVNVRIEGVAEVVCPA